MTANGFNLKEGRFKLDIKNKSFMMRMVELGQVAQRDGGCLIPGNIQCQTRWDSEQPGLVEDVPDCCRRCWTRRPLKAPSNQKYSIIL